MYQSVKSYGYVILGGEYFFVRKKKKGFGVLHHNFIYNNHFRAKNKTCAEHREPNKSQNVKPYGEFWLNVSDPTHKTKSKQLSFVVFDDVIHAL